MSKYEWVDVGEQKLKLSSLKKTLYPKPVVLKAHVIEYYLNMAPTILRHIKYRPLTLIRYPDGFTEDRIYQKERPEWTPEWLNSISLGEEKKQTT